MSRLYMTCWKFLRKTGVALPYEIMNRKKKFERWEYFVYGPGMSIEGLIQRH